MGITRGFALALGILAASFALHIVGGATDQGWLFALAVALIYASATGFPALVSFFSGLTWRTPTGVAALGAAVLTGWVFTGGALWAANGRAFAWWEPPVALLLVGGVSGTYFATQRWRSRPARLAAAG